MREIIEKERKIPVIQDVDILVLGGGCTGVFAAVRAARLGAKVAIVEQTAAFGGVATNGFVAHWHALTDTTYERQIIAGLTTEVIDRLKRVPNGIILNKAPDKIPGAEIQPRINTFFILNTEELKIELDDMLLSAGVTPYLHTLYTAPVVEDGRLTGVIIENRSGRSAITAKYFIDATADGFLGADMGMETYHHDPLQPCTTAARVYGWDGLTAPNDVLREAEPELGYKIGWDTKIPGAPRARAWFKSNMTVDCTSNENLTRCEIEGRRQTRRAMDYLRAHDPNGKDLSLLALSSMVGIREGRQLKCSYQVKGSDIYYGTVFPDAIAYCCYPVDIHRENKPTTYRFLDGVEKIVTVGQPGEYIRWRTDPGPYPLYWQLPYRCMLPENIGNLLICGRAIDADKEALAAARVMVSLNQTGEAAGVAAFEALNSGKTVQEIDIPAMRRRMAAGGSILFDL